MKKIGVLTYYNTTNYGALLQALALEEKIKEYGAECEIIKYHCENIEDREFIKPPKLEKNVLKYLKNIKNFILNQRKRKLMEKFADKHMKFSNKDYDKDNIKESNHTYDKFIVGSDMVFNLDINGNDSNFYLEFADNNKRYSYAASLGAEKLDERYLKNFKNNLGKFQKISVREIQTQKWINDVLNKDVRVNLDPTLLLDDSFWKKYEEKTKRNIKKKYILLYFLDKDDIELKTARKIAKEKDYDIVILQNSIRKKWGCITISNASVGEFLYLIHNAEMVITGSYHGMMFSINYNTNFMYYNRANASRMESIAEMLDVTNRRLTKDYIPNYECKFEEINKKLKKLREKSESDLNDIIGEENEKHK